MKTINQPLTYICVCLVILVCILLGIIIRNETNFIPALVKQNVILASGINFTSGNIVALDPTTGVEIPAVPCDPSVMIVTGNDSITHRDKNKYIPKYDEPEKKKKCSVQIANTGDTVIDKLINNAIQSSQTVIDGKVIDNGKLKDARFVVEVNALYTGSHCVSTFSAGTQRTNCINKEAQCAAIRKATNNPKFPC